MPQVRTQQGDTVDALCWRHLGSTAGVVERTLELNPGLAERGLILPAGMLVTLPQQEEAITKITVNLWD